MQREAENESVFRTLFQDTEFVDLYQARKAEAVDVVIPVIHSNELWSANLLSLYREVPVNRLLIGDGGCVDGSVDIAMQFPRVEVFDHKKFASLGFSIRELIAEVKTEWFLYLHSDVYLPRGWFDAMCAHKDDYDWFECNQHIVALVDYAIDYTNYSKRPLSGSQMGRRSAFDKVLTRIDDDYLYRSEDIVIATLVEEEGYRYGRVDETFHYHQIMNKRSKWARKIYGIHLDMEKSPAEEIRENDMYLRSLVKYMQPKNPLYTSGAVHAAQMLMKHGAINWAELTSWIRATNADWLPVLSHLIPESVTASRSSSIIVRAVRRLRGRFRERLIAALVAVRNLILGYPHSA